MTLKDLTEFLAARDPATAVRLGFGNPHSYRGYYDELAFEPVRGTTVGAMLAAAREANGATYGGWKGGEYTMGDHTSCHLALRGCTGEGIGEVMLRYMVGEF